MCGHTVHAGIAPLPCVVGRVVAEARRGVRLLRQRPHLPCRPVSGNEAAACVIKHGHDVQARVDDIDDEAFGKGSQSKAEANAPKH